MLKTDVSIVSSVRGTNTDKKWRGIWDTGASKSSIDKRVVSELGLFPIGKENISTANGIATVNTYLVNLTLPNQVTVANVSVTGTDLGNDVDILIGMDIIQLGDFSITNINNTTTFSFRIPSVAEIDYVKESLDAEKCSE